MIDRRCHCQDCHFVIAIKVPSGDASVHFQASSYAYTTLTNKQAASLTSCRLRLSGSRAPRTDEDASNGWVSALSINATDAQSS